MKWSFTPYMGKEIERLSRFYIGNWTFPYLPITIPPKLSSPNEIIRASRPIGVFVRRAESVRAHVVNCIKYRPHLKRRSFL